MKTMLLAALLGLATETAAAEADKIARGAYLAQIMDCAGCHMPRDETGVPVPSAGLSGGTIGFEVPGLGIFWPPNLTPDASGLGSWSADEIKTALRSGLRPDGRVLAPAMPWQSYSALGDDDLDALVAYLGSLKPVAVPRHDPVAEASQAQAPFFRVTPPH